jgi:DNA repair protein RecN (Recombination protein N)
VLVALRVSNFALIEDLTINFKPGLNILSGETGAGKSIVIGAINLLMGERAAVEQIRQGREIASVEGIITCNSELQNEIENLLAVAGIEKADDLIIAREVYRNGRSVARVNGRAVPASFLKELGQLLVDLHGQHQHQSLLRPEQHLELLDSFGGEEICAVKNKLSDLYKERHVLKKELAELGEDSSERERRLDVYAFQLKEIISAELRSGEDYELSQREKVLANSEKICKLIAQAYTDIYVGDDDNPAGALVDRLSRSAQLLTEAVAIDPILEPLLDLLQGASAQLEEVSHELRDYQEGFEFEPEELIILQERLNLINSLKRKYGVSVDDVLAFAERIEAEMERLKNSEAMAAGIENEIVSLEKALTENSLLLRKLRYTTAQELEKLLEECLKELALQNARFAVRFTEKDTFSPRGMDQVEFFFSANRGEEVKPLAKIISGGEVSRVMLALKTILARQDRVPTLIFDEVDAGIGGATIQAVAEKLALLAGNHQVLCVTHSPQIASMADGHFHLFKEAFGERTLTKAVELTTADRREELARMLDGASIDQVSLTHVDSLLERAKRFKEKSARGSDQN